METAVRHPLGAADGGRLPGGLPGAGAGQPSGGGPRRHPGGAGQRQFCSFNRKTCAAADRGHGLQRPRFFAVFAKRCVTPPMKKYYIWGFPGIGKSSVSSDHRIADADCERFKFLLPENIDPHLQKNMAYTQRDPAYPNNYFDYIHSVDADMVLQIGRASCRERVSKSV